ncbi:hypothetical protein OVX40_29325, partial [Klebsiella pneumoniae]|uniref:hypothetical protein n=1 Tax=Klebsiella pneumoniae TaxID=573 RepID=UPI00226FD3C7
MSVQATKKLLYSKGGKKANEPKDTFKKTDTFLFFFYQSRQLKEKKEEKKTKAGGEGGLMIRIRCTSGWSPLPP